MDDLIRRVYPWTSLTVPKNNLTSKNAEKKEKNSDTEKLTNKVIDKWLKQFIVNYCTFAPKFKFRIQT